MTVQNQLKYGGAVLTAVYDFTATELNHLFSSPVQLIAPPGPGQLLWVLNVFVKYTFGTTAYTFTDPSFGYLPALTGGPNSSNVNQALQSGATTLAGSDIGNFGGASTDPSLCVNHAWGYGDFTANSSTTGNGTAHMVILYRIINVP